MGMSANTVCTALELAQTCSWLSSECDEYVTSAISCYDCVMTVYIEIDELSDDVYLQKALDIIASWADEWQLPVSVSKCSTLTVVVFTTEFAII